MSRFAIGEVLPSGVGLSHDLWADKGSSCGCRLGPQLGKVATKGGERHRRISRAMAWICTCGRRLAAATC
jgi:hypothetical protein